MQQEYVPGRVEEFVRTHPGRGFLRVQTGTARGIFPVKGVLVRVVRPVGGAVQEFYRGRTDESGVLAGMELPALPGRLTQNAATAEGSGTDYLVSLEHPDYRPENARRVTLYDTVETILSVSLLPRL